MPEVDIPKPFKAGQVVPQDNGNFAVMIDGKVFGVISAAPVTDLVLSGDDPRNVQVLKPGVHTVTFNGKKYRVTIKNLEKQFMNTSEDDIVYCLVSRDIEKKHPSEYQIDKAIKEANDNNEKARAELLNRVVVEVA